MVWMGAWEMVTGPSHKDIIMDINDVGMGSATLGITFATISHPDFIKTMNSTRSNTGGVCHYKFVSFIVSMVLIMAATTRTSSITLTIT